MNISSQPRLLIITCLGLFGFLGLPKANFSQSKNSPFALIEHHKRVIPDDTLAAFEAARSEARVTPSKNALVFHDSIVRLVVRTGPENDMLSYRIQGLRNPTLTIRAGAIVHLLFVNVDDDMNHDMRFGAGKPPDTTGTVGTSRLKQMREGQYSAEELTLRSLEPGRYSYFCSVRNHAANGMRGVLVVVRSDMPMDEMMNGSTSKVPVRHGEMKTSGTGLGTIRSIDISQRTITIKHGNIPGVMAPMTMAYKVADAQFLQTVSVSESVRFTLTRSDAGEWLITAIRKE